jgi:hypothetical protein
VSAREGNSIFVLYLGNAHAQLFNFDTVTGITGVSVAPNTGNTFMGQPFTLGGSSNSITAITLFVGNNSGAALNLSSFQVRLQFWDDVTPTGANAFASPIGGLVTATGGALTLANNTFVSLVLTLPTAVTIADGTGGITVNWRGDTGGGLAIIPGLTSTIRGGGTNPAFAVGTVPGLAAPNFGYYRNASGRADFNFNGTTPGPSDARNIGVNSAMMLQFHTAPEPGSIALLALGGLGALGVLRRRKSA